MKQELAILFTVETERAEPLELLKAALWRNLQDVDQVKAFVPAQMLLYKTVEQDDEGDPLDWGMLSIPHEPEGGRDRALDALLVKRLGSGGEGDEEGIGLELPLPVRFYPLVPCSHGVWSDDGMFTLMIGDL